MCDMNMPHPIRAVIGQSRSRSSQVMRSATAKIAAYPYFFGFKAGLPMPGLLETQFDFDQL